MTGSLTLPPGFDAFDLEAVVTPSSELVAYFFASTKSLKQAEIDFLVSRGVPPLAIVEDPGDWGFAVAGAYVTMGQRSFDFVNEKDEGAVRAFVIVARDEFGEPRDLVAWQPRTDRAVSYFGHLAILGAQNVDSYRDGEPIAVHRSVLAWLKGQREGVAILDKARAWRALEGVEVAAEDVAHGLELRKVLTPPAPKIVVPESIAA